MITVPDGTKRIIERSRYLSEALSKNLINTSSLARYIRPELEEMLMKKVTQASIVMAIKRIQENLHPQYSGSQIFLKKPQITLTTNLTLYYCKDKNQDINTLPEAMLSKVENETIVVAPSDLEPPFIPHKQINNISSLSLHLNEDAQNTVGVYYFFLKSLAWEGVNILHTISSSSQHIMLFKETEAHRAFKIISSLFPK